MSRRVERAPAKINLGLEILGKRPDGYHEVRTVLAAISLHDTLVFEPAHGDADVITMEPASQLVPNDANLVTRALSAMRSAGAAIPPQRVSIMKRIPTAAGLGGASSDAAAVVRALAHELGSAGIDALALAAEAGIDVPFFLDGPTALAVGRGEVLTPLPAADPAWVVLAVPEIAIADKTRTMYGAIDRSWWSSGSHVEAIAERLPAVPTRAPFNVFDRALLRLFPDLERWRQRLTEAGFPFVAVTGAGPAHYTFLADEDQARDISTHLAASGIESIVTQFGSAERELADG